MDYNGNNIQLCTADAQILSYTGPIIQALYEFTLYKTLKQLDKAKLPLKSSVENDTDRESFMLQAHGSGLLWKGTI